MEIHKKQSSMLFSGSIICLLFPTYAWISRIRAFWNVPGDQTIDDDKYLQFFSGVFSSVKSITIVSFILSVVSLVCVLVYRQAAVKKGWVSRGVRNAAILFALLNLALWISKA